MSKLLKQKNKGFTLVETLVAISIFTMSILGLMSILASGITDTTYAKQKMVASYLAQEGIEYARNVRDNDVLYSGTSGKFWSTFIAPANAAQIIPPAPADTSFTRTVTMQPVSLDEEKITSDVKWTQGSGERHIIFSENLFNWVEQ